LPGDYIDTVIVVDDDPSICRALNNQLTILGFKVMVFHSAESLLAAHVATANTCLLADVYLPGMTGAGLCRKLATSGTPIPTILISGRDDQSTKKLMRAAGPVASLFKPFDQKALLSALRKAARNVVRTH
jgi:two-component system response regulator FixJ